MKNIRFSVLFLLLLALCCTAAADAAEPSRRVYTVTAPYLTVCDNITFESLKCLWNGECGTLEGPENVNEILIAEEETDPLTSVFGCAPDTKNVRILSRADIYKDQNLASSWMIIPFEDIEPRRKVIFLIFLTTVSIRILGRLPQ